MENTYKTGDVVYERIRPAQKLIVKRFASNLYYCQAEENSQIKRLVYLERELMNSNNLPR
jgi:hypothetical protein